VGVASTNSSTAGESKREQLHECFLAAAAEFNNSYPISRLLSGNFTIEHYGIRETTLPLHARKPAGPG
jgi:hypothetical protein